MITDGHRASRTLQKSTLCILSVVVLFQFSLLGQETKKHSVDFLSDQNDSINRANYPNLPIHELENIIVEAPDSLYLKNYYAAAYFVTRVYTYSQLMADFIEKYDADLAEIKRKSKRRKYMRRASRALKNEFEYDVKNMSRTRGRYLVKLIKRETGKSAFQLIAQYRGKPAAQIWYVMALTLGVDLKSDYQPELRDHLIEKVVVEIEQGRREALPRPAKTEEGRGIFGWRKRKKRRNS